MLPFARIARDLLRAAGPYVFACGLKHSVPKLIMGTETRPTYGDLYNILVPRLGAASINGLPKSGTKRNSMICHPNRISWCAKRSKRDLSSREPDHAPLDIELPVKINCGGLTIHSHLHTRFHNREHRKRMWSSHAYVNRSSWIKKAVSEIPLHCGECAHNAGIMWMRNGSFLHESARFSILSRTKSSLEHLAK